MKDFVKVRFLKAAPKFAYSAGDLGIVLASKAPGLIKQGYVIPLPDDDEEEKINTLPPDFPGRDRLFSMGFDSVEKIAEAGDSLLDEGISQAMVRKIKAYLKK